MVGNDNYVKTQTSDNNYDSSKKDEWTDGTCDI